MTSKLVTAVRRKVKADPKTHKAAYLESTKAPILEHATLVELFATVTLANDRLKARITELEKKGWHKIYGGSSKGIACMQSKQLKVLWLGVDKKRKK